MKKYSVPAIQIDLLEMQDVISTSPYVEDLNQPWAEDNEDWGIIG